MIFCEVSSTVMEAKQIAHLNCSISLTAMAPLKFTFLRKKFIRIIAIIKSRVTQIYLFTTVNGYNKKQMTQLESGKFY